MNLKQKTLWVDPKAIRELDNPDCLSVSGTMFRNGGRCNGEDAIPFVPLEALSEAEQTRDEAVRQVEHFDFVRADRDRYQTAVQKVAEAVAACEEYPTPLEKEGDVKPVLRRAVERAELITETTELTAELARVREDKPLKPRTGRPPQDGLYLCRVREHSNLQIEYMYGSMTAPFNVWWIPFAEVLALVDDPTPPESEE